MKQVYIYIMDTMSDWQYAHLLPLLNNDSFYKVDHDKIELKMVGADTWHDKKHKDILSLTEKVLLENVAVVSICASVGALNSLGILETRKHISNELYFFKLVSVQYVSESNYLDQHLVVDGNLITASALLVAYTLVAKFNMIDLDILDAWYHY